MRRRGGMFLIAGAAWGALAWLIGHRAFGGSIWAGVLASPLIGLAVGRLTQSKFESASSLRRWGWALIALYLSSLLFGLAVGIASVIGTAGGRALVEVLSEPIVGTLWGVTATGFVIALWPLTFATQWLLEWIDG